MDTSAIKFGTDGWRALIAQDFTTAHVALVAQAHAQYLKKQASPRVVIGYDTRFAGRLFALTVAQVMAANGLEVFLCQDFVPTPVLSHAVVTQAASGGVMLTASHNPAAYNGYKVKGAYGGSATPSIVAAIEHELTQLEPTPDFDPKRHPIQTLEPSQAYFASLTKLLDLETLRQFTGTLFHDAMGGAGCGYLEAFMQFANLPIRVENIRGIPDPMFYGVNPEPIPQNLSALMQRMTNEPASSVATITDGDADRVGAVLPGGAFFSSHQIFCVLLDHLYQKGLRGRVIKTVSTTQLIEPLSKNRGLEVLETPVGFKYITDAMLEGKVLIGGEESGGLGVIGHIPERDGLLNSLLLLEAVATQNKGLAEIFANLETEAGIKHHYDRVDLHLSSTISRTELETKLEAHHNFAGYQILKRSNKDGIKLHLENHTWVLFRPSGTEPVLRLYCEAPDKELVTQILETAVRIFTNNSGTQG
ncbi:MAG: hypothetical protein RLZZ156_2040 [Deinococcota bacterium]|jgi:phosphomannomutase